MEIDMTWEKQEHDVFVVFSTYYDMLRRDWPNHGLSSARSCSRRLLCRDLPYGIIAEQFQSVKMPDKSDSRQLRGAESQDHGHFEKKTVVASSPYNCRPNKTQLVGNVSLAGTAWQCS
jgi:hypothetical protein